MFDPRAAGRRRGSRRLFQTAVRTVREKRRAHQPPRRSFGSGNAGLGALRITNTNREGRERASITMTITMTITITITNYEYETRSPMSDVRRLGTSL